MYNEKSVLEIVNYMLSLHGLAQYANCPNGGEFGTRFFNFVWSNKPMKIQFLIQKSSLLLATDLVNAKSSNGFTVKYEKPYCFLEWASEEELDLSSIKPIVDKLSEESKKLKPEIVAEVEKKLATLAKHSINESLISPQLQELKLRIDLLKSALEHEFYISCDKMNIPVNLVFPEDSVFEKYHEFFNENFIDYKKLCSEWYQEFRVKNKYP